MGVVVTTACAHDGLYRSNSRAAASRASLGTVFEQTKLPLPNVFLAVYLMTDKQGISAMALRKHLGCHYDTAYRLLMLLRGAMADRDQSYALAGIVQVDEAYVGGHGDGRHREVVLVTPSASSGSPSSSFRLMSAASSISTCFLPQMPSPCTVWSWRIRPGTRLLTDEWRSYRGLSAKGYDHQPSTRRVGHAVSLQWPLVHRAISNCNRRLLGTHRTFCLRYLPDDVAEFCWRANRATAASRTTTGIPVKPRCPIGC